MAMANVRCETHSASSGFCEILKRKKMAWDELQIHLSAGLTYLFSEYRIVAAFNSCRTFVDLKARVHLNCSRSTVFGFIVIFHISSYSSRTFRTIWRLLLLSRIMFRVSKIFFFYKLIIKLINYPLTIFIFQRTECDIAIVINRFGWWKFMGWKWDICLTSVFRIFEFTHYLIIQWTPDEIRTMISNYFPLPLFTSSKQKYATKKLTPFE